MADIYERLEGLIRANLPSGFIVDVREYTEEEDPILRGTVGAYIWLSTTAGKVIVRQFRALAGLKKGNLNTHAQRIAKFVG